MTKRVKLLSVMVAAVLCFVAGFALLFGSNKTAEAAETYTKQNVTFVNNGKFYNAEAPSEGATTVTFEWKNNGKTVFSSGGGYAGIQMFNTSDPAKSDSNATNYTYNLDANHWWQWGGVGGGVTADAIFKNTSYESFKLVFAVGLDGTATREEAFKMYGVNGETETQLRYAGNPGKATWGGNVVDGAIYYGVASRISSGVTISVDDLMCYDSNGNDLGVKVVNEVAPEVDASAIEGKDLMATSNFWVANKTATTSKWIFLEWENDAGNTTARTGGGWTWGAVIGDETLNSSTGAGAPASNVWGDFGTYYFGQTAAGKKVRVEVNTVSGSIAVFIDGVVHGSGTRSVEGLSNFKFRTGGNSAYTFNSIIYNAKAYDEFGNDLGFDTNMKGYVNLGVLDAIDTSNVEAKNYGGSGTKTLYNATASESEWIVFEWTNDPANDVAVGAGHMFSYGLATSKNSAELISATDRTQLLENEGTTRVAFHTKTGVIYRSFNYGAWSECPEGTVKSAADVGALYAGILWNNGNVLNAKLYNLKCYDAEGNDLGVDTNFTEILVLPESAVKPAVDNRYYANDAFNFVSATATSAQYIIFEYTLKAGTGITSGSANQNGFISSISNNGTVTNDNIAGSVDGFLYQYGSTPSVYSAYEWFTAGANDTAVKMVVDTKTGIIYVAKNGGDFESFAAHGEVATLTGTDRYFGITTNAGAGGNITGFIEDLVCYDSNGVNLGVKTSAKFGEVVEGKVVDIVGNLGANEVGGGRYIGNIYFKDLEGNTIDGFCIGSVPALKYGEEATTLNFSPVDGAHQLFSPANNGKTGTVHNGWEWDDYNNEWYVVEAGTLLGGKVILAEDMIIRMHGSSMQLFNASHEFAINYAGLPEGAVNANPTSYTFFSNEIVFEAPSAEGATFYGWNKTSIPQYSIGNVTVTASWYTAEWAGYNLSLTESIAINFNVNAFMYNDLYAEFTMIYDGENAITEIVKGEWIANGDSNGVNRYRFTFDRVLPQHLNDTIMVKITNGLDGYVVLETAVSVKEYLDTVIASESFEDYSAEKLVAFKAIAEDLLYYGAAAQLFTGHETENLPADLDKMTDYIGGEMNSVYHKTGVKDKNFYWYEATIKYAETVKLCITIAAPSNSEGLRVEANNFGEIVSINEFTVIEGEIPEAGMRYYEFELSVAPSQFDSAIQFTIYYNGVSKGQVLTYSVNSYIAVSYANDMLAADYKFLLERLYLYGESTREYYQTYVGTSYTTEYYVEKADGSYELLQSELCYGEVGSIASAVIKNFDGYVYNSSLGTLTGTVVSDGSLTLKVYYTAKADTAYTVEYYVPGGNGYVLYETVNGTGKTGATVNAEIKRYTLYSFDEANSTISGVILGDGSLVLKVYYVEKTSNTYVVEYYLENADGLYALIESDEIEEDIGKTVNAEIKIYEGYDYNSSMSIVSGTVTLEQVLVLKVYYTARTDTPYQTEHYVPDGNGGYILKETSYNIGKTGSTVQADLRNYIGYGIDSSKGNASGVVAGDGSLVLQVYYSQLVIGDTVSWNNVSGLSTTQISTSSERALSLGNYSASGMNKFKIVYTADHPVQGTITIGDHSEVFYLEAGTNQTFTSFTDFVLGANGSPAHKDSGNLVYTFEESKNQAGETIYTTKDYIGEGPVTTGVTYSGSVSVTIKPIESVTVNFKPIAFYTAYQNIPNKLITIENDRYKVGTHLYYGGSLTYFEDKQDGRDEIGNIVNIHDAGRLVQQSFYSSDSTITGGLYNPVQGGNGRGYSKIVDFSVQQDRIYVKGKIKDWNDTSLYNTGANYMENWYILQDDIVLVQNSFIDFNVTSERAWTSELPALYWVGALRNLEMYRGDNPWTGDDLTSYKFTNGGPAVGYHFMDNTETWTACLNDEGWGVGVYTPGVGYIVSGYYGHDGNEQTPEHLTYDPLANPTVYIGMDNAFNIDQFEKFTYSYMITTGEIDEIRDTITENKDFTENTFKPTDADKYDFNNTDFTKAEALKYTNRYNNAQTYYDADRKATKLAVSGNGYDPYIALSMLNTKNKPIADDKPYVAVEYMVPTQFSDEMQNETFALFFGLNRQEWVDGNQVKSFPIIADGNWHVGYVDLSDADWYSGAVNVVRLDFAGSVPVGTEMYIKSVKFLSEEPEATSYADTYTPTAKTWLTQNGQNANGYAMSPDYKDLYTTSWESTGWLVTVSGIHHFEFLAVPSGSNMAYNSAESEKYWQLAQRTMTRTRPDPGIVNYANKIGASNEGCGFTVVVPLETCMDGRTYTIYVRAINNNKQACLYYQFEFSYSLGNDYMTTGSTPENYLYSVDTKSISDGVMTLTGWTLTNKGIDHFEHIIYKEGDIVDGKIVDKNYAKSSSAEPYWKDNASTTIGGRADLQNHGSYASIGANYRESGYATTIDLSGLEAGTYYVCVRGVTKDGRVCMIHSGTVTI